MVAGALIFTATYFNHQEKMKLIDECGRASGYPEVDSRDSGGVDGTTNAYEAQAAGGYNFKCRKR